jgi:hypothetical protein
MGRGEGQAKDPFSSVVGSRRGPVSHVERARREEDLRAEMAERKERERAAERLSLLCQYARGQRVDAAGLQSRSGRVMNHRGKGKNEHVEVSFLLKEGELMAAVFIPQIFSPQGLIESRSIRARLALGREGIEAMRMEESALVTTMETPPVTAKAFLKRLAQDHLARPALVRAGLLSQEGALSLVSVNERQRKILKAVADFPHRYSDDIAELVGDHRWVSRTNASLNILYACGFLKPGTSGRHRPTEDGIDYLTMLQA